MALTMSDKHTYNLKDALKQAQEACDARSVKFTPLREHVLKLIWQAGGPAKAYDILDALGKSVGKAAKPPTVYRTLDFLLELGVIHKLNRLNAYVPCAHPHAHKECYFLICKRCESIQECCNDWLKKAIEDTAKANHFVPIQVSVEIEGLCQNCRVA